jgi:hypothetical protein
MQKIWHNVLIANFKLLSYLTSQANAKPQMQCTKNKFLPCQVDFNYAQGVEKRKAL